MKNFNYLVAISTIRNSLKPEEGTPATYSEKRSKFKKRKANYPELEQKLLVWFYDLEDPARITDDAVQLQAKRIWERDFATDAKQKMERAGKEYKAPKWSNGWVDKFKKRYLIKMRTRHGESADIDPAKLEEMRSKSLERISLFRPSCIYNCDETALWWERIPNRSLTSRALPGKKKSRQRISLMFCCNSDGSDKMKPMFIGHTKRKPNPARQESESEPNPPKKRKTRVSTYFHRCFGEHNSKLPKDECEWRATSKAWMTYLVMMEWLRLFNDHVKKQGKHALLLMDNHSSHKKAVDLLEGTEDLSHVDVHFLPPNTTSKLQPLDQGIIQSFKCRYTKRWLTHMLDKCEAKLSYKIDLLTAVEWSIEAWKDISKTCISNCWRHTGYIEPCSVEYVVPEASGDGEAPARSQEDIDAELLEDNEPSEVEQSEQDLDTSESPQSSHLEGSEGLSEDADTVDSTLQRNLDPERDALIRDNNDLIGRLYRGGHIEGMITYAEYYKSIGERMPDDLREMDYESARAIDGPSPADISRLSEYDEPPDLSLETGDAEADSDEDFVRERLYPHKEVSTHVEWLVGWVKENEASNERRLKSLLALNYLREEACRRQ